jgi:hypothetical protein
VLKSSSDVELESETDLLIAAAGMVNEHFLMPPRRGWLVAEDVGQHRS